MKDIDLIKEFRNKTLEKIIEKHGKVSGLLTEMKLSIWDVREILYEETKKMAQDIFNEEFSK